jgi:hypothetical protein
MAARKPKVTRALLMIAALAVCALAPLGALAGQPATQAEKDAHIAALIAKLGDPQFNVREAAQAELVELGPESFDALTVAERHEDLEIASRARYLLGLIQFSWVREDDPPEVREALSDYENLDAAGKAARIEKLARRPSLAAARTLCRLTRFEKSHTLSKLAAAALMEAAPTDQAEFAATIAAEIGNSPRPAAEWLRAFVAPAAQRGETLKRWQEFIAREETTLQQTPEQSRPELVLALVKTQVGWLKELGRDDEANAAIERIVAQESGESASLAKLVRWLSGQQAWDALDQLAGRFVSRFTTDAALGYLLAEARAEEGDQSAADELAQDAFALNAGDAAAHLAVAQELRNRGQLEWAEREWRYVLQVGRAESVDVINAQFKLAELLHDRAASAGAADVLDAGLAALEKAAQQGNNNGVDVKRLLEAIRGHYVARSHYYHALGHKADKNEAKLIEHLDAAALADPLDADVLIELHRLPSPTAERRKATEELIETAARTFRAQIAQSPREATGYNQLAWLLSNTGRDLDEALRCSLESLKLKPGDAGLLDTLGRCYFALGDVENAVKQQRLAVDLEPHSGVMRRQLEEFEAALKAKNGK